MDQRHLEKRLVAEAEWQNARLIFLRLRVSVQPLLPGDGREKISKKSILKRIKINF
jgi:hypothetical protein